MRNDHLKQKHVLILRGAQSKRNQLIPSLVTLFVFIANCYSAIAQVGPDAPNRKILNSPIRRQIPPPRPAQRMEERDRARGLFVTKRSDALTILVLKNKGGALVPVDPSAEFNADDQIKVQLESNFDGFIYVVNIRPSGKSCLVFPYPQAANNAVRAGERYDIPPGADVMEFDQEKGTEILQMIMSRTRIPYLDSALKQPEACFSQTASRAVEVQPGLVKKVTPVLPQNNRSKSRSRDIILRWLI